VRSIFGAKLRNCWNCGSEGWKPPVIVSIMKVPVLIMFVKPKAKKIIVKAIM